MNFPNNHSFKSANGSLISTFIPAEKALLITDGVNLLTLVLKWLPGNEMLPQLCTFYEILGNSLSSDKEGAKNKAVVVIGVCFSRLRYNW